MKGVTPNMKKSHEYDSPVLSRLVSVVTVFAICICSICCIVTASKVSTIASGSGAVANSGGTGGANGGTGGASYNSGSNQANTNNSGGSNNQASNSGGGQANNNSSQGGGGSAQAPEDSSDSNSGSNVGGGGGDNSAPQGSAQATPEEILAKYTEVMNKLKTDVATYEKKEFQQLADDYDLGTVGNLVLPIAQNIMTSEEDAELQQRDDAEQIPIIKNSKGCLLTDVSAIKSATMTEDGGKTTIVIVLNDESGAPAPTPEGTDSPVSNIGAMFNPLSKEGIDDIVSQFSGVLTVQSLDLTYKDCTATLVFNTDTLQVESLEQIMNVYITVDAKVTLLTVSGYATLINTMRINNITYK